MTSGEDYLTANLVRELEGMEEDSFSSALIPLVKSASSRGNRIQLSLEKLNGGPREFIQMREVPPDGRTAGGWRSVDENERAQTMRGCLSIAGLGLVMSMSLLCWVVIFRLFYLL